MVTGGAGFIGSHTVDALLKKGYKVRIMDSLTPPVHMVWPDYLPKRAEVVLGDVRNREDWEKALEGVDYVFHFAAFQDYLPYFSKFFHVNTVATALLYEIIVEKKLPIKKIVVASSQAVYGEGKYKCEEHGIQYPNLRPVEQLMRREWEPKCFKCGGGLTSLLTDEYTDETYALSETNYFANPHNQYAMSKYAQEIVALALGRRYKIPTVALRYSIVQGARQSPRNLYSGVLRIFTLNMLNNRQPVAYEDGMQLRDYVNIADVVKANLLVLEDKRADYEIFNVGGGKSYTVLEFGDIAAKVLGVNIKPKVTGEFRFGDTRHIISDISKLEALGWKTTKTPKTSVREYANWIQTQKLERDYTAGAEKKMRELGTLRRAK